MQSLLANSLRSAGIISQSLDDATAARYVHLFCPHNVGHHLVIMDISIKVRILLWWAMENSFNFNYVYFLRKYPFSLFKLQKQYRIYAAYKRAHTHTQNVTHWSVCRAWTYTTAPRCPRPGPWSPVTWSLWNLGFTSTNTTPGEDTVLTVTYIHYFYLKGEFTFFYSRMGCPPIRGVKPDGQKSVEVKFFTVAFFWCT